MGSGVWKTLFPPQFLKDQVLYFVGSSGHPLEPVLGLLLRSYRCACCHSWFLGVVVRLRPPTVAALCVASMLWAVATEVSLLLTSITDHFPCVSRWSSSSASSSGPSPRWVGWSALVEADDVLCSGEPSLGVFCICSSGSCSICRGVHRIGVLMVGQISRSPSALRRSPLVGTRGSLWSGRL